MIFMNIIRQRFKIISEHNSKSIAYFCCILLGFTANPMFSLMLYPASLSYEPHVAEFKMRQLTPLVLPVLMQDFSKWR